MPSQAFIIPSFQLIKKMVSKTKNLENAKFVSKVDVFNSNGELEKNFIENLYVNDDLMVIQIQSEQGEEIFSGQRKITKTKLMPPLYDLFFIKDSDVVFSHLKTGGLALKTQDEVYQKEEGQEISTLMPESGLNFVRYENRTAVLISEEVGSNGPKLWIEKESWFPLKAVLFSTEDNDSLLEYRFLRYQPHRTYFYPHQIQIYKEGKLWIQLETKDVKVSGVNIPNSVGKSSASTTPKYLENYVRWVR